MIGDTLLTETVRVYVWEWPVRVCHWLIAGSIAVLSLSGLYIANPSMVTTGLATQRSLMGLVKLVHYSTAIVFGIAVLTRVYWMFVGNIYSRWDKFVPARKKRWKAIGPTLKYYTFRMRKPPGFVGHNPLAGITYAFVFVIYLTMIGTGLAHVLGERARRLAAAVVPVPGAGLRRRRRRRAGCTTVSCGC